MAKNISILGSTGSIGVQTLEVVKNLENVKVMGLTGNNNIDLLEQQILEFKPLKAAVMDTEKSEILVKRLHGKSDTKVLSGMEGLIEVATMKEIDTLVNSVVGIIGLVPTIKAIENKKDIALANKETLVTAGKLIMDKIKKYNVKMYPIDSEHSAIFQALQNKNIDENGGIGTNTESVDTIYLTASGGPFREKSLKELENVTLEQALKHPNWEMGKKITIDSATLMNKGLEVIEAYWLFGQDIEKIKVIIHPQSIIHSMVLYNDSSIIAQLGAPSMKVPIQYALTYPLRVKNNFEKLDFMTINSLTFHEPNLINFPCLQYAFDALKIGGTMPAFLNGANEMAVELFLNEKISFLDIPKLIKLAMETYIVKYDYTLQDILDCDDLSRETVKNLLNDKKIKE